jgi:carboxyl-terminal processing protease
MRTRDFVFIVITVLVMSCLTIAGNDGGKQGDLYEHYQTFSRIVSSVTNNYVEDVDTEKLFYGAYTGMLQTLDPHSAFLPPEEKEDLEVETQGEFGGLGIEITLDKHGVLTVVTPLEDTPAFGAGVLANDRIIKIEGKSTKNITVRGAVKKLRGPKGSPVKITVLHENGKIEDITIIRDIIKPTSIKDPHFADEKQKIAYLRMTSFQKHTATDLDKAVRQLQAEGMRAVIIDLRANPGGLLDAAVAVSDRFLSDGVIVSTKGRKSMPRTFRATEGVTYADFPVALLISSHSASASEIFAGAIQDRKRGVVVGVRSYGKGSVQSLIRIEDGKSAIRLTTARYYTPSGQLIHRNVNNPDQKKWGIDPDIEVKVTLDDEIALWKHWRDRHQAKIDEKNGEKKDGSDKKDDKPKEAPKPDKDEDWVPKNNGEKDPKDEKPKEFHDKTLEAAVNALKGMILAQERLAPAAKKAAE